MDAAISSALSFSNEPLPSYETMIVETLQVLLQTSQGVTQKDIFDYMMNHWPLIPNFRPSATQALQRAFKRGRLIKVGKVYSLNLEWTSGHTNPDESRPARHLAKRPASIFAPRPPHLDDTRQDDPGDSFQGRVPNGDGPSAEMKATARAAENLLRCIMNPLQETTIEPIFTFKETDAHVNAGELDTQDDPTTAFIPTHDTGQTMPIRTARRRGRPATGISPRPRIPNSAIPPPVLTPVSTPPKDPQTERRIRKSIVTSLETIVSQLRVLRAQAQAN